MKIHLITVVGGRVSTLGHMLNYYLSMDLDSILLYVHSTFLDDPLLIQISDIARSHGINVAGQIIGDWAEVQHRIFSQMALASENEWYLIADQDEFQYYTENVRTILQYCETKKYSYLRGCFIDRFSADGLLPDVAPDLSLSDQFPIGSFFTLPVMGGHPMKVVAARGGVKLTNGGHHRTLNGVSCPPDQYFIQVHHYKWTKGLLEYLSERSSQLPDESAVKREDHRFTCYYQHNGNIIDLSDPGILAAPCSTGYIYWETVRAICATVDLRQKINTLLKSSGSL